MIYPERCLLACALALAVPLSLSSQQGTMTGLPPVLPPPSQAVRPHLLAGDFLGALLALRAGEARYLASEEWRPDVLELESVFSAILGDDASARALADARDAGGEPDEPSMSADEAERRLHGGSARDAMEAVVEAARTHRVVMLNEAHHLSEGRAFALRLLEPLRRQGFRYLAVEALDARDTALQARGYPAVGRTGLYTSEPVFGELLRAALRLGYVLVPYDVTAAIPPRAGDPYWAANERERMQAQNLRDRVFARDPAARVLVYAGYGHVIEHPRGEWRPMALQLKEMTGLDPLTVDQTVMSAHATPAAEHPLYRAAVEAGLARGGPVVVTDSAGAPVVADFEVDLQVFHPRPAQDNGRPSFLRLGGLRSAQRVGLPACASPPCLVRAFAAAEGADAVPLDQVLAQGGARNAVLFLPRGPVRIQVTDAAGTTLAAFTADAGGAGRLEPAR